MVTSSNGNFIEIGNEHDDRMTNDNNTKAANSRLLYAGK
jgi:hypothetical protein